MRGEENCARRGVSRRTKSTRAQQMCGGEENRREAGRMYELLGDVGFVCLLTTHHRCGGRAGWIPGGLLAPPPPAGHETRICGGGGGCRPLTAQAT